MTFTLFKGCVSQTAVGDVRASLAQQEPGAFQTCVTSPPYYGLRDYGVEGQIGLEESPEEYLSTLVDVFRSVRRVLADDGTLWLNIGDSYARNPSKGGSGPGGKNIAYSDSYGLAQSAKVGSSDGATRRGDRPGTRAAGDDIKEKDLLGIPWMLAFALRADGWYLRQDIIWHKPNPMPESVGDRCTKAHEYLFLLTKSPRYYFDHEAIKEPVRSAKGNGKPFRGGGSYTGHNAFDNSAVKERETHGNAPSEDGMRNKRSVWTVATRSYAGAHFATFPPALVEPCILAGSRPGDIVLDPFGGSGTTGGVALANGRHAFLCELNQQYADLHPARIESLTT